MSRRSAYRPLLAVTMGDPAGIGPEIAVKCFSDPGLFDLCRPVLIGHRPTLEQNIRQLGSALRIHGVEKPGFAECRPGQIDLLECGKDYPEAIPASVLSAGAGDIAFRSVQKAIELAIAGEVEATVTGPIHKEALRMAGQQFAGHTEIYARFTGTRTYGMLLAHGNFRVIHVSTHVSLREACELVKKERILETIQLLDKSLRQLGFSTPRIGVAGLNPHSGDGGLFGLEEIREITPAIRKAISLGIIAEGPVPADTLFSMARGGRYDGCVAMYHDQGHIPFKFAGFSWDGDRGSMESVQGVNITLGLPIIRTSVDHGTAFDIAGKGIASANALRQAIEYAIKLCQNH